MTAAYRGAPPYLKDSAEHRRQLARSVNAILQGALNVTAELTLAAGASSTTLVDGRIAAQSAILLMPTTASAAAELAAGTLYVPSSGRVNGEVSISHAVDAATDRTFIAVILG